MSESITTKRCSCCNFKKPTHKIYFPKIKGRWASWCYPCNKEARRQSTKEAKRRYAYLKKGHKICTKCDQQKPATYEYFFRQDEAPDGLRPDCKECKSARDKAYVTRNADKVKAYHHERYIKNPEKVNRRTAEWRANNPELSRQRRRREYMKNREQNILKTKEWAKNNPERYREMMNACVRNRRARVKSALGKHTADDVAKQLAAQKNRCWWCGIKLISYQVDHVIPISKGGSNGPENIVCACRSCNASKGAKMPSEWAGRLF